MATNANLALHVPEETSATPEDLAVVRPPPRRRGWLVAAGLAAVALGAGALLARGGESTPWETQPATTGALITAVTAVGSVEPLTTVEVGSDQSGALARVLAEQNVSVRAGEVLAELDPDSFQSAVALAVASVQSASASVDKARVTLADAEASRDRTVRLEAQGAAAATETQAAVLAVDRARADLQVARASLAQARAELDRAEQDLQDTVIVSPIDGVVVHRYVEPGQTVVSAMQATPLFELASDLHQLKIEARLDEASVGRVRAGQTATFTVSAWPERTFVATVASLDLAPDPDDTVVSYAAELRVDNPDLALRPGMTATAQIEVASLQDVVRIPQAALRYRPDGAAPTEGDTAYVLADGQPQPVQVEVLGTDGLLAAVSGIEAGADVIVGGGR
jgi:HlyD family secretion protein